MRRYLAMKNLFYKRNTIKNIVCVLSPLVFCLCLSVLRVCIAGDIFFLFLIWNVFLAFIPLLISYIIYSKHNVNHFAFFFLLAVWLLFFPNAPYILTDMVHLKIAEKRLQWFDLILVFSYSLTGLLYSFLSLHLIEKTLQAKFNIKRTYIIALCVLYLSAFGIYLGRFLRWNSWDIFSNMRQVLGDVLVRLTNPITHMEVWQFTFLFGSFLTVFYFSCTRILNKSDTNV